MTKVIGFLLIIGGVIWNGEIGEFTGWNLLWLLLSWVVIWSGIGIWGTHD